MKACSRAMCLRRRLTRFRVWALPTFLATVKPMRPKSRTGFEIKTTRAALERCPMRWRRRNSWRFFRRLWGLFLVGRRHQAFAAFGSSSLQNIATCWGGHTCQETVIAEQLNAAGLISAFHKWVGNWTVWEGLSIQSD